MSRRERESAAELKGRIAELERRLGRSELENAYLKKLAVLGREAGIEPRNGEKARAIQETRKEFPKARLRELLEIAGMGKSSYLYCLKKPGKDEKNAEVNRLMRDLGLRGKTPKRKRYSSYKGGR